MYIYEIGPLAARRYLANGDVNRHEVSNATRTLRARACPDFIYIRSPLFVLFRKTKLFS